MIQETKKPDATEKLGEAILHIASRCRQMRAFGRTKLNRVLFFADFAAFQQIGRPVTEATYLKKPNGPVVSQLPKAIDDVRELNAAELSEMTHETEAWRLAEMDGPIPIVAALIPRDASELTDAELAYATELSGAEGAP